MDLMSQATSFGDLEKKYNDFCCPTVKIAVDGTDLVEKYKAAISGVSVELGCGYAASGCSFDLTGEYLPENSDFNKDGVYGKLELGAKVEVSLGYIAVEKVFAGLITEISYAFNTEDAPYIHVECMDAKALLMKTQRLEIFKSKDIAGAIESLLMEKPASAYLNDRRITVSNNGELFLTEGMESDYSFIVRQAQYVGCEFFIIAGIVYVRGSSGISTTPILTLSPDDGLHRARLSLSGAELVKTVKVVGIDPANNKVLSEQVTAKGTFGDNSMPASMLNSTVRNYFDARANTKQQITNRAKTLMAGIENRFGRLEAECVGLPDLVPGRMVEIKGLSARADRKYYITEVRHRFDDGGFTTTFEARIDTL